MVDFHFQTTVKISGQWTRRKIKNLEISKINDHWKINESTLCRSFVNLFSRKSVIYNLNFYFRLKLRVFWPILTLNKPLWPQNFFVTLSARESNKKIVNLCIISYSNMENQSLFKWKFLTSPIRQIIDDELRFWTHKILH